jgi:hypothetical protein
MLLGMQFGLMLLLAALPVFCGFPVVPPAAIPQQPTATSGSQGSALVTVDFRVFGPDGAPVLDLNAEDVTLKVGGRAREIIALELMRVERRGGAPSAASVPAPPPPFITNTAIAGDRDVVFLVDEEGIPAGREATVRTAFGHLLAALGPTDRISVLTSKGRAVWSAPTTDRRRVTDALGAIAGRAPRGETTADAICRSRINLFAVVDALKSVDPSASTVIVFVTNGFTPPTVIEEIARGQGPEGPCELMPRDLSTLTAAADASHAHLFVAQVVDDGLPPDATATEMTRMAAVSASSGGLRGSPVASAADLSAGLEHVAGLTGNGIIRLMGDSAPSMQRIARETSAYYLAAFEVPASEQTGATQRVDVSVNHPGVTVRVHPTLVVPKTDAPGGKRGRSGAPTPRDMLSGSRIFHELPLRATVFTSRAATDGKLRVVVLFETSDPAVKLSAAAAALFDDQNKARAQWTAQASDLTRAPIVAALAAPGPGDYRLRVAATDASGAGATVDEKVTVEALPKGAAWVGSLVLGVSSGQGFTPRLQFANEEAAVAMVEVAGLAKTAVVAATFELAGSETGPALATLTGTTRPSGDGMSVAFVGIPIGAMPPGDVVVRAVITVDGQPLAARPARTMRKVAG